MTGLEPIVHGMLESILSNCFVIDDVVTGEMSIRTFIFQMLKSILGSSVMCYYLIVHWKFESFIPVLLDAQTGELIGKQD